MQTTMGDQQRGMMSQRGEQWSTSRQIVKFLTAGTIGASLMGLSGLTLTGTTIGLVVVTPLLVIFSPVIVPAAITVFLLMSGFLLSGAFGVSSVTALTWLYKYVSGRHPPGADQLDYAKDRLADTAKDMKEKAKEYGQYVQQKATEVTHQS